jgi:hypothetical protein
MPFRAFAGSISIPEDSKSMCCLFSVGEFALPQKSLYNVKTKVLVLRIGDIGEMKIQHMQLHLFHQHRLCFINGSVS